MHSSIPAVLYPLTSPQREIWFDQLLHEGVPLYNIGGYVKIPGAIDVGLFEQAVNMLLKKHDALRTILSEETDEDGIPLQGYVKDVTLQLAVQDFSATTHPHEVALQWMQQRFIEPFALKGQPLFRCHLIKISEACYYYFAQYHHLIIDGYGMVVFNHSLAHIYTQLARGESPHLKSPSYTHFIENDRTYIESPQFEKQRQYWLNQFSTPPEPLFSPRGHDKRVESGCEVLYLPRDLYHRLQQFAKQHRGTLFHVLLGCLYVYFTRIADRDDFVVGLPILNRANAQFKQTIGLFTGVSPALFNFGKQLSFIELLQKINKTLQANYRHQRFPLSEINRAVGLDKTHLRLFDVVLSYENYDHEVWYDGINSQTVALLHNHEQMPLMIFVREFHAAQAVKCDFVFNLNYFNSEDIQALQARFVTLLTTVLQNSLTPLDRLPVMTELEQRQLMVWNDTTIDYPQDKTIIDLFEQQVARTPDNIAVVFENTSMTYRQLNAKANQLARYLLAWMNPAAIGNAPLDAGLPPTSLPILTNPLIAIAVDRSLEMVIGLLGILKAGSAYVPIDPSYPAARIEHLLTDSAAPILLTQRTLYAQLPSDALTPACEVICLDDITFSSQSTANPPIKRNANDLAYVIYTSGSTGKPKGVLLTHQGLSNYLQWAVDFYEVAAGNGAPVQSSIGFDATITSLYLPLLVGKTTVLVSKHDEITALMALLKQQPQFSLVKTTPAHLDIFNQQLKATDYPHICQRLVVGGDALTRTQIRHWREYAPETHVINQYGPTETVVGCCVYEVKGHTALPNETIPIGQPIANTRIYILDSQNRPHPPGIAGELCIAGAGVGRGYLNLPELTAEQFIEIEIFGNTERIYKSGDLARWRPDGHIEFLGRIDQQVKLRGFRIELGEIEAVLSQHAAVKHAVVTVYGHDTHPTLAAYVTVRHAEAQLITALKDELKARLPEYMIPNTITVLDKLPLTPNGKIDRSALPAPTLARDLTNTHPLNPTEALLASLWAAVLRQDCMDRDAHFFELGGHSLRATQLVARIRDAFAVELPIRSVFETPVLAELALKIEASTRQVNLPPITPHDGAAVLSFAQQRLWFLNQLADNHSATYNMPAALRVVGKLNLTALQHSFQWLLERHHSLRTCFPTVNGQAQVQVLDLATVPVLTVSDLTALSPAAQAVDVQNRAYQHALAPFDLATGLLFKADVLQLSDNQAVLLINMHHIVSDGWSIGVFVRDWQHAYTAFAQGELPQQAALEIQYQDYAAWQRHWLQGAVLQQQLDYWQTQLAGSPARLELPTDKPRPPQQGYQGARYVHSLSAELTTALHQLSQQHNVSLFMTLLASFNILLSRYSGQDDICVGSPIANRTQRQTEDLIGCFVNTLVLRTQLNPDQSFIELLQQTRQTCLAAYAHQDIPFEMLVEQLQPMRHLSHSPLFQVMLVLQNHQAPQLTLPDLNISVLTPANPVAKFDLTLNVEDSTGQLQCVWEYATDLFDMTTIEGMAGHFASVLNAIVIHPEQAISRLPMLTAMEIQQLQVWNDTATDCPQDLTIVDLFEQQAAKTPDNIAVGFAGASLTYRQLNAKANQLAHYLKERVTPHPNSLPQGERELILQSTTIQTPLIAIAVERCLEMVIGLLGILKAGSAYVPIDPSYPTARIEHMLADSATPLVLTHSSCQAQLPLDALASGGEIICLDKIDWAAQSTANLCLKRNTTDLAYVMYTSGSTGQPKGVMIEHAGLVNLALAQINHFALDESSHLLQFASISFDASVSEILTTLLAGATLHVIPQAAGLDTTQLAAFIAEQHISHVTLPPSLLRHLPQSVASTLATVVVAGEACPAELITQWAKQVHFVNAYGPTESTVCASMTAGLSVQDYPHIGQPLANTRIYILDAQHQPQPLNIAGELCIAGLGLARGYLNRPELTAEKFIEVNVFGKRERIYKTGDLARWRPSGQLEYLGRLDQQVKLRGFRIELGEIEAVLSQHTTVKAAVVILYANGINNALAAYVSVHGEHDAPQLITALKEWLKTRLPAYMVPSYITLLDKLPLTPNGKIDRNALPAPEAQFTDRYAAPRNAIEQQLAHIWSQLLTVHTVGIHDNFFGLGGDSILSIQIVAGARQVGLHLTPRDIFQHQTIAELAHVVGFEKHLMAEQGLVTGQVPITPIQHRFFAQQFPQPWHFNQSVLLQVPVELEVEALRQALAALLVHHDALRLRYQHREGEWQQCFSAPTETVPLIVEDLSGTDSPPDALLQITASYQQSLNFAQGPLTYLVLCRWTGQARLFWCVHHLVVDGISWRILLEDLHSAYQHIVAKQSPQLPAKTSSYKAWAEHLATYAQSEALTAELRYWQALPSLSLPLDNPAGENRLEHAQHATLKLSQTATEALLKQVPVAYNTQINDILLTALALTLQAWTGHAQCLINLERHGRGTLFKDIDLSRTVGWFTSIHPVALTLPAESALCLNPPQNQPCNIGYAIKAIKEQLRAVPHAGIGYGVLVQRGEVLPQGQILFNYLGQLDAGIEKTDFRFASEATASDISRQGQRDHLLDINGAVIDGQLALTWTYSNECYHAATIAQLTRNYQQYLQQLITHCQAGQQGVTPADFPLAAVMQTTLDALYHQYAGLQDLYPLSPMQQGMLFHALYEPTTGVYFEQMHLTLTQLEPTAFKAAWQYQLARHPIFRSAFVTEHSPILQVVHASVALPWREHDWRADSNAAQHSQLQQLLQRERQQGFDLTHAPLMRFDLIRIDAHRYIFVQHHHHILMDGWCLPIIFSEVRASYLAFKRGQTPQLASVRPYRDYIAWLQQQDTTAAHRYWQQRLAGLTAPTPLPILTPQHLSPAYHEFSHNLSVANTQRLHEFGQRQRFTLNTLIQGAWGILLSRYSGESTLCFGVTVSGRQAALAGIEQMIGLFINTLPLHISIQAQDTLQDYLLAVQTHHQNDNRYAYTPLHDIQQLSAVPNGTALFESLLVFENYPLGDALAQIPDSFQIEALAGIEYTHYPLTVAVIPGKSLQIKISYDRHRISSDSIERLGGHLTTLLMAMVENPQQAISELPMLTEPEIQQLHTWNKTATDYPADNTIVALFEQQVAQTPNKIAVVFVGESLTYQQLNEKANQLAHYLLTRLNLAGDAGVAETARSLPLLIAIAVERCLEMVIGLLGILKAGHAYVPIDPNYPTARIEHMLTDSAAPIVLTQSSHKAQLPVDALAPHCEVICLDEIAFESQPSVNPAINRNINDLAYVIYTSGSTGQPKGVMIEHAALYNFVLAAIETYAITSQDNILQFAAVSFDTAAEEIYPTLLKGATLVLRSPAMLDTTETFLIQCTTHKLTVLDLPTAYWQQLVAEMPRIHQYWPQTVRLVLIGGEAVSAASVNHWLRTFNGFPVLINTYGPTETTVVATCLQLIPSYTYANTAVPIGHPISNLRIYILDRQHRPQPLSIPGELCIAGAGLARGYLNRPELTAAKFIEVDILGKPERLYKTGDLARWRPDGQLEYLGRIDQQVKLRGFRIELGEIEAVLSQHSVVKAAVVTLYKHAANQTLAAYVTVNHEAAELIATLRDWLNARLPDYMLPSYFTILDKLPVTPHGKIDRTALPAPTLERAQTNTQLLTPTEALLASLWAAVLKHEPIHRDAHFFALGGHSLLATQLVARVREAFKVELPIRSVFDMPVLAELAVKIDASIRQTRLPSIPPHSSQAVAMLSFAQQRLWFLNQLEGNNSATYNMPAALRLVGKLNRTALQHSLHWLLERHHSLRTCFPTVNGQAQVRGLDLDTMPVLTVHDLTALSPATQTVAVQNRANQHALAPFDLANGPLFKADVLNLNDTHAVLLLNMHHIISDGWSIGVLIRDWQHAYTAFAQGEQPQTAPLEIQYQDYAAWQRHWLQGEVLQQQLDYWQTQLAGSPELLELPTDSPRPPQHSYRGGHYGHSLNTALTTALNQLSQQHNVSLFMTLLASFDILLARYSRQDDICVGTPIANRTQRQTEDLIGCFVNTLVLRAQLNPQHSFIELLQQTRQTCLAAYAHQDIPFEMLVEQLQPTRSLSHSPLFQVMLVLQNTQATTLTLPDLHISALNPDYPIAKFDLTVFVEARAGQLHCTWEYATDLFHAATIERMAGHFETLLNAIIAQPEQAISQLSILTALEIEQLQAWNDTAIDYPPDNTIVTLFEQQVAQTPDHIAVVFADEALTYQQLNEKANQLAHYLLTRLDFAQPPLIAIAVERSLAMVIGLLGILKAGGAYVPIDLNYPAARIEHLLTDSAAPIVLTQTPRKTQLPLAALAQNCEVICLDDITFNAHSTENPTVKPAPNDLAYVIYTSGSTGKPKGALLTHQGLSNYLQWAIQFYAVAAGNGAPVQSSIAFDATITSLYLPLLVGKTTVLVSEHDEIEALIALLRQQPQFSLVKATPAHLHLLNQHLTATDYTDICQRLVIGGEALTSSHISQWRKYAPQTHLINQYGPTETVVGCCAYAVKRQTELTGTIPIGQPIANTRIYLLNAQHQPQPPNIPGELCIAGAGVGRGYLNLPELTAEKFIEVDLFGQRERIYKTGDLARWRPDGHLEYLGRTDHQVKLRGFRIELGEIEAVLLQHLAVKAAVVILYQPATHPVLAAYVTVHHAEAQLITVLKDQLKAHLPDYMVPSYITLLDKLPLTPHGKIDRHALPAPALEHHATETQPLSPTEALLASLWAAVLNHEPIHRDAHFFALGGHSLLATQLIARIREAFAVELPIRSLFATPVLSALAVRIDASTRKVRLPPIRPRASDAAAVLSFAQQRLWFLTQLATTDSATYNMPVALRLVGALNLTALQHSLHWLLERHHSLRTCFPTAHGQAQVQVLDLDHMPVLTLHDLTALAPDAQAIAVHNRANQHAIAPFDLATGPLFKADLLQLDANQAVLLLNMHHIISDGWSSGVFIRDWQHAYSAFVQGEQPQRPPLKIQYQDYAAWQRQWLQGEALQQQLDYWQTQLAGRPELLELSTDKPRPPQQSYHGARYRHSLSVELTAALKQLSQQHNVSLFMTLLASFNILLSRYSRQDDICVGSPIANRTHRQTEDLMGLFINTLVLRTPLNPQQSFIELLQQTRHICLAAYAHQDIPFEMLVEHLQPTRSLSHTPLFQVMLVLQNNPAITLELPHLNITALNPDYPIAKFDLTLYVEARNAQLHCVWEYATDLFDTSTIERMAEHFAVLLNAIVAYPAQAISQLSMLTAADMQQLRAWNDTVIDYPQHNTLIDLFEQQAVQTPDNTAVVFAGEALTYRQLNAKANQLAHYLLACMDSAQEERDLILECIAIQTPLIAIAVERSLEMVIGLLGILKAGAAYVPIDPSYPVTRIEHMLTDSAASLVLTQSSLKAQLPLAALRPKCTVIYLDKMAFDPQSADNPPVTRNANDLAYVIYTSGSTGKPKGVMITQANVLNFLLDMQHRLNIGAHDKLLAVTTLSFDIAALELFLPILAGSCLHLANQAISHDGLRLQQYLAKQAITVMQATPATWQLLQYSDWHTEKPLKILCGGETLTLDLAHFLLQNSQTLWNVYGPTETTIWSTAYRIPHRLDASPAIGTPIANTRIYILNAQHQPQPPNVPGELCIAGAGLARGYLNHPELTAEKFIEVDLFGQRERIYKTGDLARWRPDGHLDYLGRIDHQVKLRGFRIELGEIEAVLSQHAAVKAAVVVLYEADDTKQLVAYVTTNLDSSEDSSELIRLLNTHLKAQLPDYMIPRHITVLDALPLTPNGKIDRNALPAPDAHTCSASALPRNALELQLLGLWKRVLNVQSLGIHDNFFDLGGHSLLAVKLMSYLHQYCGVRLPVSVLFQTPTIATLAQQLHVETTALSTHLVSMQTAGQGHPIYCLPGAVGSVMYLYPLASDLRHTVYALQTPGLDGTSPPTTVTALAQYHLQALQQHQSTPPYYLIGHSAGGRVAFEMAWQLEQQGQTVAFLGILDAGAPDTHRDDPTAEYAELNWLLSIVRIFTELTGIELNCSLATLQALPDLEAAYTHVLHAFIKQGHLFAPDAPLTELKALVNTYRITRQAHSHYQTTAKLRCPIHLFRAQAQTSDPEGGEYADVRPAWGWAAHTESEVREHSVPGTHVTMMTVPHVHSLAAAINACL